MANFDIEQTFDAAVTIAKKAGVMIKEAFYKGKNIEEKAGPCDLVTETDKAVEKMVFDILRKDFPSHKRVGEETTSEEKSKVDFTDEPTWFVDPVDGTMNFVHSFPYTCISIGVWVNKEPHVAVIFNPILEHMYTAKKGQGAYLNGDRIKTSQQTELSKSLLMTELWHRPDPVKRKIILENFTKLTSKSHGPRGMGSAALNMCMVAQGSADIYLEIGIHAWDMAAGALMVTEAGGVVRDMSGAPLDLLNRRLLCAASAGLSDVVVSLVEVYEEDRD